MPSPLSIYHRLPYPARVAVAGARGLFLRGWRYGFETDRLTDEAMTRDTWSSERWASWREPRLQALLEHAATDVPYYRERAVDPAAVGDSTGELSQWPLLPKAVVRERGRDLLSAKHDRWLFADHTSGTSGTPVTVWEDRAMVLAWYALHEARVRRWNGVTRHDRWGILGGQLVAPPAANHAPYWVWNAGLHQLYLSAYHLAATTAPDYGRAIDDHQLRYLLGYPSALYSLATGLAERGYRPRPLRVVLTNAEPLFDHQRSMISEVFGCPVRDTYGMAEAVVAASECAAGQMHLWPDAGVLEVLEFGSDRPAVPGASGRFVATGLLNTTMPLIRYETGDTGALAVSDRACACGRNLPIIERLEGRIDDLVVGVDGRSIGRLDPVFKADLPIREAQIIQESPTEFRILVVPVTGFGPHDEDDLRRRLRDRVGDASVAVELVDAIPRDANGKFKAVVSMVRR